MRPLPSRTMPRVLGKIDVTNEDHGDLNLDQCWQLILRTVQETHYPIDPEDLLETVLETWTMVSAARAPGEPLFRKITAVKFTVFADDKDDQAPGLALLRIEHAPADGDTRVFKPDQDLLR